MKELADALKVALRRSQGDMSVTRAEVGAAVAAVATYMAANPVEGDMPSVGRDATMEASIKAILSPDPKTKLGIKMADADTQRQYLKTILPYLAHGA